MTAPSDLNSKIFKRAEKHLRGKLNKGYLERYDHHVVPGYNLNKTFCIDEWSLDSVKELYQKFPYKCDLPKPLLPPAKLPRAVLHEEDPALESLSVQSYLKDDINRILDYCEKHKKELPIPDRRPFKKCDSKIKEPVVLPKYVAEIAELIELDPDPYLKGNYNWYYTGGSLTNGKFGDQTILLYPYAGELVASPLMSMKNALLKPMLNKSTKLNLDGTLYELRCNSTGDTYRILGRYKNHCILYKLGVNENKLLLLEDCKQTSTLPYTSADLNPINEGDYCTVTVDRMVTLWNINVTKRISGSKVLRSKVFEDNWGSIKYQLHDPNVLIFTDRCCLHYLDTRMKFDLPALSLCPKQYLEECESLSVEADSRYDFCRYIGTYHNLFLCDSRSPKQCVRQKWTHQFKTIPLLLTTINRDEEEILGLSSLLTGENSVILNTWTNDNSHSYNLPLTLPSILETLNESQLQGLCLDPYLRNRLELCNTGSTLLTLQNEGVFFFVQTSIGDIFYQCITHEDLDEHPTIKEKSISALSAWEQALLTQDEPVAPLSLSNKFNMKNAYESFTNRRLKLRNNKEENNVMNGLWRQSLEELASYEDILASELLAVWEISDNTTIPLSAAPHQKVLNWLEATDTKVSPPPEEDVEYIPTPINTQELVSVSQEPDLKYSYDSSDLPELLLPKVKTKSNKKKYTTK